MRLYSTVALFFFSKHVDKLDGEKLFLNSHHHCYHSIRPCPVYDEILIDDSGKANIGHYRIIRIFRSDIMPHYCSTRQIKPQKYQRIATAEHACNHTD